MSVKRSRSSLSLPALAPPMLQAEPTGMLPAQPCPHAPLQRSQPTLPTARHPTSSTGRETPFVHTLPGTNPLELAPNPFPAPHHFAMCSPPPSSPGREKHALRSVHQHHHSPKQCVSTMYARSCPRNACQPLRAALGAQAEREGLVLCVSAGWVWWQGQKARTLPERLRYHSTGGFANLATNPIAQTRAGWGLLSPQTLLAPCIHIQHLKGVSY